MKTRLFKYIENFTTIRPENFSDKNSDIFHISAQIIDCGYSLEPPCLYNFEPLKSHFYIVKLGFTGVYIIFLISAENIDCGYSLEQTH